MRIQRNTQVKILIQAAVVTLFAASVAQAQQAVQWKVSDGGNGHWYACVRDGAGMTVQDAANRAAAAGAHLLTGCSSEFDFAVAAVDALNPAGWVAWGDHRWGPWIGLRRVGTTENFEWVDGTSCVFDRWDSGAGQPDGANEDSVLLYSTSPQPSAYCHDIAGSRLTNSAILEWSSDCNSDGIVDYGQCHDGTLPDFNGNNIPDCCERGEVCVTGTYPVQWRIEEAGNGHWYQLTPVKRGICWEQFRDQAVQVGGYLATSTSAAENAYVYRYAVSHDAQPGLSTYLGGFQSPDACEPDCGWTWVTEEPWVYSNWADLGCCTYDEDVLELNSGGGSGAGPIGLWRDDRACLPESFAVRAVYEWSADCNADGIVDYGQILQGQLADANANGVPDTCESPTCADADLFPTGTVNGADLGALLSQWGEAPAGTASDLNRDGAVDGTDLGILLAFWGPCPN